MGILPIVLTTPKGLYICQLPNKPLSKGPNIDEIHLDQRDGFLV